MMQQPSIPMTLPSPMNGNGMGMMQPLQPPSPMYTREDIVEMTNQHERDTQPLRDRMIADYNRYRLTSHVNKDRDGQTLKNYAVYTSNTPKVFADKVVSWLQMAEMLIRVPHVEVEGHKEEQDNVKEQFAIGNLRANDERLRRLLQPSLRGSQASFVTVRGGYVGGRCLLVKNPITGDTYANITAWDPMHIHWGLGPEGLEWACYKTKLTRAEIAQQYGVELGGSNGNLFSRIGSFLRGSTDSEREGIWVYDFYDGQINTVVTDHETLKPPTSHGSPRVPVYLTLVGPMPQLQSEGTANLSADVGESVFASSREVGEKLSDLMSIFQEIVERARRQTTVAESRDGKKTLEEDPFIYPTTISTTTGDKIYTLELQKMAQETMAYMTAVMGEYQRATLPYSSYGETPFQLSGFAITQLRQASLTVLSSRLEAIKDCNTQIVNLLYDQYMTGAFDGMRLSGMGKNRKYFNQMITPDMMENTCDYTVELVSQLPQDDMAKWATAKIAKEIGVYSDVDILDKVLGEQDAQQTIDKVRLQRAEQGLPEAQLYTMMMAALDRGDTVIAKMYLMEYQRLMAVKLGIMPPAPADGGGGGGAGGGSAPPRGGGQRPEVMPDAATGAAPQPETSNQGPSMVPPGTPRPAAQGQQDQNRQ